MSGRFILLIHLFAAVICFIHSGDVNTTTTSELPTGPQATQFTLRERSYLTSAVAASALVANFIVVQLVNRFGIRTVFALLGLMSAAATAFLPTAVYWGFRWTLAARVVQGADFLHLFLSFVCSGLAFASNFPVIGGFTAKWTYYKQNGLFVSVLVAYVQFSPTLTMPISGALCESSYGWPSVFYGHAVLSAIAFVLFGVFYRNNPSECLFSLSMTK